jgi:predicted transcriptional regulator
LATEHYAYILSIDEKHWNQLCQQNKSTLGQHVFIRKNTVAPKTAQQLLFYVTHPKMQILGAADFVERLCGNTLELWNKFGGESCFESMEDYMRFASGRQKMTFIRFNNFTQIANPMPKTELQKLLGSLDRFSTEKYLDRETALRLL